MASSTTARVDELRERVAPTVLAAERTLPIPEGLAALLPDRGIVCGRSIVCAGPLSTSLATALIAPAVVAGSWACVLDLPTIGVDALYEQGIPLERVVAVDGRSDRWADIASAAADGFDLILTSIPGDTTAGSLRRLAERLRRRGTVLIAIGDGKPVKHFGDVVLTTSAPHWSGLHHGAGHLRSCEIEVSVSGRRQPGTRCRRLTLLSDPSSAQDPS